MQTSEPADAFDFPLLPREIFGPYVPNVSGPLPIDTRYGAQNPGLGAAGKCFVDRNGNQVPFNSLFHAGEDWFAHNARGRVDGRGAAGVAVRAIANGAVTWTQDIGADGYVVVFCVAQLSAAGRGRYRNRDQLEIWIICTGRVQ